jgi:hypothetical protein
MFFYICVAVWDIIIKRRRTGFSLNSLTLLAVWDLIIKRRRTGFSLNDLTLPHVYVCPKPGHGFPFVVVFFVFNDLKWEVVVGFCWYCWPSLFLLSLNKFKCPAWVKLCCPIAIYRCFIVVMLFTFIVFFVLFPQFGILCFTDIVLYIWGHRCRDRMVVGFTTTYAISAYHH